MSAKEMTKRIAVALIGIPLILACIWAGGLFFLVLVSLIEGFALFELYRMAENKRFFPSKALGICILLLFNILLYLGNIHRALLLFLIGFLGILAAELFKKRKEPLANAAISVFGVLYIMLFSSLLLLRQISFHTQGAYRGERLVVFLFALIWICDSAALFIGRRFGKNRLYRQVSPNKTWEGAVGGFVITLISAGCAGPFFMPFLTRMDLIAIGAIVGIIGQIGDLVESLFKRDAGVKDSSPVIPGHGGFLDRFDSPLFVGPAVLIYLAALYGRI
ncbi:phosphatidate cytidylyltransferase [bacterium]|nr:phosphatidate cytidylyltransferase [bacterium]